MQVLKATGLKTAIDKGTFAKIAHYIDEQWQAAALAQSPEEKEKIWDMAMQACACLKENATTLHDNTLYQELKQLTFVPATKVGHISIFKS